MQEYNMQSKRTKAQAFAAGVQLLERVVPKMGLAEELRSLALRSLRKDEQLCLAFSKLEAKLLTSPGSKRAKSELPPAQSLELAIMVRIRSALQKLQVAEVHRKSKHSDWKTRLPGSIESGISK
jgi:hypothetical protein